MSVSIQLKRGTAAAWLAANPALTAGEMGLETDTGRIKIGDGVTGWASLGYALVAAADLTVTDTKQVIIGSNATAPGGLAEVFQVIGTGGPSSTPGLYALSNSQSANVRQYRQRTTGAVLSGDVLGANAFFGFDGLTYKASAFIRATVDGVVATNSVPSMLTFLTTAVGGTSAVERMRISASGVVTVTGSLLVTSTLGYVAGAGGTVTQLTSRTTGVTLSKSCGAIALFSATTTAGQVTTCTITNTFVAATDVIIVSQKSGAGVYLMTVSNVTDGSFKISIHTPTAVAVAESPVINFSVIKAVAA